MRNLVTVKLVKLTFVVLALAAMSVMLGGDPWGPW